MLKIKVFNENEININTYNKLSLLMTLVLL